MKTRWFLIAAPLLLLASLAFGQGAPENIFIPYRQIGKLRPSGIQYDANFDRFAMVDLQGRLVLADAATYQTQHILYEQGAYNAYKFSHDGRYLALAIDRRVELWDTQSGELRATFEPQGALRVEGPLHFTPDDRLLLINSVGLAPEAIRRSENDTSIVPWLWDLPAARREARTILPSFEGTHAFFDFRNGLVIGPNYYLIAGLPSRLQVINGADKSFPVVGEIESSRFERDPIYVWRSLTDDFMYVDPQLENEIVQVDPRNGQIYQIPLGRDLNYSNLESVQGLGLSNIARILAEPNTQRESSLLSMIFGYEYRSYQNYDPTTYMLLDILQPMTVPEEQMGLLVYSFNEAAGRGVLEFIRPPDVLQMELSPDRARLMVRREYGLQPIEVYNLDTGVLERTYVPAEPDYEGRHVLAYNAAGDQIITDFERLDARTGEVIERDVQFTGGFERYFFTEDSKKLVTITGTDWRLWDIETGQILQRAAIILRGDIMDQSPDGYRFLTRFGSDQGEVIEIVDVGGDERRSLVIPYLPNQGIEAIIPSEDWGNYLVVYSANPRSQHYPGNEIAVYNFTQGKLLFAAGDDLPPPEGRSYGWLDNRTIYIRAGAPRGHLQPERIYGLEYDASGLPECLVRAFPDEWQAWTAVWEGVTLRVRSDELGRLAQRLCAALPSGAGEVVPALTPTAPYTYYGAATPIPITIPGVPVCLTSRFQREALDYAALWREMTTGLSEEQILELEEMLCEGLISSVYSIEPTPTVNPNMLNPATPTPVEAAPESVDRGSEPEIVVMAIDIETGQRSVGSYLPPQPSQTRDLSTLYNLFLAAHNFAPNNPVLSPDGELLATFDQNGFVTIYRLARTFDQLMAEEADAQATLRALEPSSIGLQPTPTPPFRYVGELRPTLTPTISPTPPARPRTQAEDKQYGQVQEICPAGQLYDVSAPPPDYAANGRLFTPPITHLDTLWVLEPETGQLYPDESLPRCNVSERCSFSFDQEWVLRQGESVIVSRPDGSEATILYTAEEQPAWPQDIYWQGLHTLQITYQGYLPDKYRDPVLLFRRFDPATAVRSEPFEPEPAVSVPHLPTSAVGRQPGGMLELLRTPYNSGAKYYIYDRATEQADYFARVDEGSLESMWHPMGWYLYYRFPDQPEWYVFDARTRQHAVLGDDLPALSGTWSRDGRYSVDWFTLPEDEQQERLVAGELLPKISVWDSETGLARRYCLPETGRLDYSGARFTWSPDNRYLALTIQLPVEGDFFPTPTTTPDIPVPTSTPVPLETQYQHQFPRTMVLDTQTGYVTVLNQEIPNVLLWTDDGGGQ